MDKKSFLLYRDQRKVWDMLSDTEAGELIKAVFAYADEEDKQVPEKLEMFYQVIKLQMDRDYEKWEQTIEQRRLAGKASAEKRKQKSTVVNGRKRMPTNSTDNVNVNVNDTVNDTRESSPVRKFGKTEFLEWFNKTRTEHLKQPSNFKVLTYYDQTNLSELTKNYTGEDFVKAFNNMIKDGWARTNNKVTPDHFLKPENFNKYLNTNKKQSLN